MRETMTPVNLQADTGYDLLSSTTYGLERPLELSQLLLVLHYHLEDHRTLLQREAELVCLLYWQRFELFQEILAGRLVACLHEAHELFEPLDQIHRELHGKLKRDMSMSGVRKSDRPGLEKVDLSGDH